MANQYLSREDAPISEALWEKLDATMMEAAKSQLAGRRLLHVEGPFGLGLKVIPLDDMLVTPGWSEEAEELDEDAKTEEVDVCACLGPEIVASPIIPVALIRNAFTMGLRDIAAFERDGVSLNLANVAEAAIQSARLEDELVFNGSVDLGTTGLMNVAGNQAFKLASWDKVGHAASDIISAVTMLDASGFHGPYSLALAPKRYNQLLRLYPQGVTSELQHVQTIVTAGVFKAPSLRDGGVLLASGVQFASIVLGQDMSVGFVGPSDGALEFSISESLALRVRQPSAVCALAV